MTQSNVITCSHCANPIPEGRGGKTNTPKYCSDNCGRMARYYRIPAADRVQMNARFNQRRHEVHLLPRVRSILRLAKEVRPGSYLARYLVITTLAHAQRDWKLAHALNYAKARDAMAHLIGGHIALEYVEDQIATITTETRDAV